MNLFELKDKVDSLIKDVGGNTEVIIENPDSKSMGGKLYYKLPHNFVQFRNINDLGKHNLNPFLKEAKNIDKDIFCVVILV